MFDHGQDEIRGVNFQVLARGALLFLFNFRRRQSRFSSVFSSSTWHDGERRQEDGAYERKCFETSGILRFRSFDGRAARARTRAVEKREEEAMQRNDEDRDDLLPLSPRLVTDGVNSKKSSWKVR